MTKCSHQQFCLNHHPMDDISMTRLFSRFRYTLYINNFICELSNREEPEVSGSSNYNVFPV